MSCDFSAKVCVLTRNHPKMSDILGRQHMNDSLEISIVNIRWCWRTRGYLHNGYKTGVRCVNAIYLVISNIFNVHPFLPGVSWSNLTLAYFSKGWRLQKVARQGGFCQSLECEGGPLTVPWQVWILVVIREGIGCKDWGVKPQPTYSRRAVPTSDLSFGRWHVLDRIYIWILLAYLPFLDMYFSQTLYFDKCVIGVSSTFFWRAHGGTIVRDQSLEDLIYTNVFERGQRSKILFC